MCANHIIFWSDAQGHLQLTFGLEIQGIIYAVAVDLWSNIIFSSHIISIHHHLFIILSNEQKS